MKGLNITLLITTLFLSFNLTAQKTYFVDPNGTGQGTSWHDAAGDLSAVLFAAKSGDQVWVAKGTYLPTADYNRDIAFQIPNDVKVYGGFKGNETSLNQRDYMTNTTVLSGELNSASPADNSYNVVVIKNANKETLLDGFTITNGTANGNGTTGVRNRCGGALYIDGSGLGNSSNPKIANCTFVNNQSRDGGAVYNNGIAGQANPTFVNCSFAANLADLDGGAIFNDGRKNGQCSPVFVECNIEGNSANYGGGVCNYAGAGESSPVFNNCHFANNNAKVRGGGMYNMDVEGICEPTIKHCSFTSNDASTGASLENLSTVRFDTKPVNLTSESREWSN